MNVPNPTRVRAGPDLLAWDLASGDGYVGLDDLDVVLVNWNTGTPPAIASSNIPEPGTLGLLLAGCLCGGLRQRAHA